MIVLDASIVVELLANDLQGEEFQFDLDEGRGSFIAPHLLDVEVASALRRLYAGRRVDSHRGELFLKRLASFPIERYPHAPLLHRIWELRNNFTAYDAVYIALAEATDAVLFTMDAKLRTGHRATVRLFRTSID